MANPYEVRLDVLKLATEILSSNVHFNPARNVYEKVPFTTEEVLTTANTLYSFVNTRTTDKN